MTDNPQQPAPEMNVNQIPATPQEAAKKHEIDPVQARRAAESGAENIKALENQNAALAAAQAKEKEAEATLDKEVQTQTGNLLPGLSPDQIASIAAGNPDPNAPANPATISPLKEMTLAEIQQYVLTLETKIDILTQRFNSLASENFKVSY